MDISQTPVTDLKYSAVFDASPWGGGAVLYKAQKPLAYMKIKWTNQWAKRLECTIGKPDGQTSWEYTMLLLTLLKWGSASSQEGLAMIGDNTASLTAAANLKGKGALTAISREIAWRKVRHQWRFAVGHLPSEANVVADALSRLSAPPGAEAKTFPAVLQAVHEVTPPTFEQAFALDRL